VKWSSSRRETIRRSRVILCYTLYNASAVPREEKDWRDSELSCVRDIRDLRAGLYDRTCGRRATRSVAGYSVSAFPWLGLISFASERTNVQIRRRPDVCLEHIFHMLQCRRVFLDSLGRNTISGDDEMQIAHIGIVSSK
jgi:hypothetical protein